MSGTVTRAVNGAQHKLYDLAAAQGFAVKDILVEGRVNTDPDVLLALINIEKGDPLFAFDPDEARDLIERIAWVRSAHVERRLPSTIYIGLTERVPMALWQNKGKIRLIDEEGVTLTDTDLAPFKDLPIIVGEDAPAQAPDLLALLEAEPLLAERLEAATWVGERRWDLKLKKGMTIKLPETDVGFALRRLARAQEDDGLLDKDLIVIDARQSDRLTVRTRPGAVETYRAGTSGEL
ncbi:MAG: FtsQ-type POTRA domain-containing protein [Rhodospirillales bacterium]|nr:FtsQ-type POTRA domain-containing protein [Rhodospirillales bacterium]